MNVCKGKHLKQSSFECQDGRRYEYVHYHEGCHILYDNISTTNWMNTNNMIIALVLFVFG